MEGEGSIQCGHVAALAEIGKAGDAEIGNAAGHDAAIMREIGRDIDGEAVQRHPFAHAHANGADLRFRAVRALGPHAHAARCRPASHAEVGERGDHPAFQRLDEPAHVAPAPGEVDVEIDDALAGAMRVIGGQAYEIRIMVPQRLLPQARLLLRSATEIGDQDLG